MLIERMNLLGQAMIDFAAQMEELKADVQTLSYFFKEYLEMFINEMTLLKRAFALSVVLQTEGKSRF